MEIVDEEWKLCLIPKLELKKLSWMTKLRKIFITNNKIHDDIENFTILVNILIPFVIELIAILLFQIQPHKNENSNL